MLSCAFQKDHLVLVQGMDGRGQRKLRLKWGGSCNSQTRAAEGPVVRFSKVGLPILQRQDRQDSMARISVSRELGSSPKCTSDCAITHRIVCVPVMKKEGRWLRRSVGSTGALCQIAVLRRLEQGREGHVWDKAKGEAVPGRQE